MSDPIDPQDEPQEGEGLLLSAEGQQSFRQWLAGGKPQPLDDEKRNYYIPGTWNLASPIQRLGAQIIDTVLVTIGTTIVFRMLSIPMYALIVLLPAPLAVIFSWCLDLSFPLLPYVYYVFCYATSGQTLGKKIVGIEVVGYGENNLSLRSSLKRSLAALMLAPTFQSFYFRIAYIVGLKLSDEDFNTWIFPAISLVLLIDHLWALWDKDRQTLHDKLAGTLVVKM